MRFLASASADTQLANPSAPSNNKMKLTKPATAGMPRSSQLILVLDRQRGAMETAAGIGALVEQQIEQISDPKLINRIRELLVAPYVVEREWDYGAEGDSYPCWTVLEHRATNTAIAFCSRGFGPAYPWGLVFLSGDHMSIGMDCAWYATLEDAMRESMAWDGDDPVGYQVR